MNDQSHGIRIGKLNLQAPGGDSLEAKRTARRVAELLGAGLAGGPAVRGRREALINIDLPPGLAGERLARFVAQQILRQLR